MNTSHALTSRNFKVLLQAHGDACVIMVAETLVQLHEAQLQSFQELLHVNDEYCCNHFKNFYILMMNKIVCNSKVTCFSTQNLIPKLLT